MRWLKMKVWVGKRIAGGLAIFGTLVAVLPVFKLVDQILYWLRNGVWEPYSVRAFLSDLAVWAPSISSRVDRRQMIAATMDWPTAVAALALATTIWIVFVIFAVVVRRWDRELQIRTSKLLKKSEPIKQADHFRDIFDFVPEL